MKNKLFTLLIAIFSIVNSAFAFTLSNEVKAGVIMFGKISIGVILSIIIIWFGLNIYKKILEKNVQTSNQNYTKPKSEKNNKKKNNNKKHNSSITDFTCDIDDAKTLNDAIRTFLTIDNRH